MMNYVNPKHIAFFEEYKIVLGDAALIVSKIQADEFSLIYFSL
jgi:hypothetical protein